MTRQEILQNLLEELQEIQSRASDALMEAVSQAQSEASELDDEDLQDELQLLVTDAEDFFCIEDVQKLLGA
jgi:gas vesicle protein